MRAPDPTAVPLKTLIRQFWESFTGGDVAYAPIPIRIDLGTVAYRDFRRLHSVRESDLFHVAHQHLCRTTDVKGPLNWRPGLLPELTTHQESVDGETPHAGEAEPSPFNCS